MAAALKRTSLNRAPLFWLAVTLSGGIVAGKLLPAKFALALLVAGALVFVLTLVAGGYIRRLRWLITAAIMAAFLFSGLALSVTEGWSIKSNRISRALDAGVISFGEPVEITGTVTGNPEPAGESLYLALNAERIRAKGVERDASGTVLLLARLSDDRVRSEYNGLELRHGARIRLLLTLEREDKFRNPGVTQFTEYLERAGYDASAVIKSPLLIERLDDERVLLPLGWLYDWRSVLQQKFCDHARVPFARGSMIA